MDIKMEQQLMKRAIDARKHAYVPYSGFSVGAALLCKDGAIYTGCNIENAAYTVCNCAERTALFKAVSEGVREFEAIAVAGGPVEMQPPLNDFSFPCGVCRQALYEFAPDLTVLVGRSEDEYQKYILKELLPNGFNRDNME